MERLDLNSATWDKAGHCIYCGSQCDLTREHIVPLALNGSSVIPEASCKGCAIITGRFEGAVLRGPMKAVRVLRAMRSRSKHKSAPKQWPIEIERNGKRETLELPIEKYPIILHFPVFGPPAILHPDGYKSGIRLRGMASVSFGANPDQMARELGATSLSITSNDNQPVAFARMLAKIAFATAYARDQLRFIEGESTVIPAIRGNVDDIGMWVWTLPQPIQRHPGIEHRVDISQDHSKGFLIAEVQLFADSETPSYGVILGNLRSDHDS